MRYSKIAVSAVLIGAAAAAPKVVYETEVATITSCAPDVSECPGNVAAPTPAPEVSLKLQPPRFDRIWH